MNGVLVIDKPGGMTSHDVVGHIRKRFGTRRVGHLGTLDPAATGVLPLTLGKATRLAQFIPSSPKEYTGTIRLGWETTTCDAEGEALADPVPVQVERPQLEAAAETLTGVLQQTPPAYSAKKVDGVRAHRLARRGIAPELKAAEVEVFTFAICDFTSPVMSFRIVCSSGTYVRSLARDLGRMLGTGGHLQSLRRTAAGPFRIEAAARLEDAGPAGVIPMERVVEHLPGVEAGPEDEKRVARGQAVSAKGTEGTVRILNKKGELIAVGTAERGWAHPRVVLI